MVTALAFAPDDKTFLSGGEDGSIRLWSVARGNEVWGANYEGDRRYPLYRQYGNDVQYVAFLPDGKSVFSAQRAGTIKLWEVQSGKEVRAFHNSKELLWSAQLLSDGKSAVTTSAVKDSWIIHLWDTATGEEIKRFNDTSTAAFAVFLSDGKRLLSGGNHSLRLWDISMEKLLQTLPNPTLIDSIALAPDGKLLLVGVGAAYRGGGVITEWEVMAGKITGRLTGHASEVMELSFSLDSQRALSEGHDNTLVLWVVPNRTILHKLKAP